LDLYKIWKNQELSNELKTILKEIMIAVGRFIIHTAPGSLYGEWAKKEECWNQIIEKDFGINLNILLDDLEKEDYPRRKSVAESDIEDNLTKSELELIKSIPLHKWSEINKMGLFIEELTPTLKDRAINIQSTLKIKRELSEIQRKAAITIIDIIVHKSPEFFDENEIINENVPIYDDLTSENALNNENVLIRENTVNIDEGIPEHMTSSLLKKMVDWDIKSQVLSPKQRLYVYKFVYENKKITSFDEKNLSRYLQTLKQAGFEVN
ncbi:MAG: hypothetical protein MUP85_11260, partial [Candidatus Lokiarchaeota archaeon]|nr:hypothetical protein [Candidatus Lokiarchaeota archaeon]